MRLLLPPLLLAALATGAQAQDAPAPGMEHAPKAEAYARGFLKTLVESGKLQEAIKISTDSHRKLSWEEARLIDRRWRDELADGTRDQLVDSVIDTPASAWLDEQMSNAPHGAVTEIAVMDGLGWSVAETRPSADFFQADEKQWQEILPGGPNAVVVSELEDLDGTGPKLALVSLPVRGERGNTIGVVTIGIDVTKLP